MPTGKDFHRFCRELAREVGIGRAGLRRDWTVLEQLVRGRVLTQMTSQQVRELLDKDASQLHGEFNDLKALAAYGVARGWVDPKTLREALQAADQSNPLWFLANVSGKTFGGSVAPKLAEYWLCEEGDRWIRRKDCLSNDVRSTCLFARKRSKNSYLLWLCIVSRVPGENRDLAKNGPLGTISKKPS